jgi:hypothetical protein
MRPQARLQVSAALSKLMGQSSHPPDPPRPLPVFSLPSLPPPVPGDPIISVHCFLTGPTSLSQFTVTSRAISGVVADADGQILRTKYYFKSVSKSFDSFISKNLDREIVNFLCGRNLIFCSISRQSRDLSAIPEFILTTNAELEESKRRHYALIDDTQECQPLSADTAISAFLSRIVPTSPPNSTFFLLNLTTDAEIRSFSLFLHAIRTKAPLSQPAFPYKPLLDICKNSCPILIFLFTSPDDQDLLSSFADRKKSTIEKVHPPINFEPTFSPPSTAFGLLDRASEQLHSFQDYLKRRFADLSSEITAKRDSSASIFDLLAVLKQTEDGNAEKRARLADIELEIAQMQEAVEDLKSRQKVQNQVNEIRQNVQLVISRTGELRARTDELIAEIWDEVQNEKPAVEIPAERRAADLEAGEEEQKAARRRWLRQQRERAENQFSGVNTPERKKRACPD